MNGDVYINGIESFWAPFILGAAVTLVVAVLSGGIWIGGVNEHRRNVVEFMKEIRDDITEIREDVKGLLE